MGIGSNGQGSGGGNGGKGGNPQGNKPSGSGAQNTTTRKVRFCMDYNEEPAPAKTLRFIEKGFDLTPSPFRNRYDGNKRSRHHDEHAPGILNLEDLSNRLGATHHALCESNEKALSKSRYWDRLDISTPVSAPA